MTKPWVAVNIAVKEFHNAMIRIGGVLRKKEKAINARTGHDVKLFIDGNEINTTWDVDNSNPVDDIMREAERIRDEPLGKGI